MNNIFIYDKKIHKKFKEKSVTIKGLLGGINITKRHNCKIYINETFKNLKVEKKHVA